MVIEAGNIRETSLGLEENVEAMLSYVLMWVTGIIFLLLEKKSDFVRFHAAQSTITFLGFTIISVILNALGLIPFIGIVFQIINWIVIIIAIITWIICLVKAYQGERFKLPITGDWAEKFIGQSIKFSSE